MVKEAVNLAIYRLQLLRAALAVMRTGGPDSPGTRKAMRAVKDRIWAIWGLIWRNKKNGNE